MMTVRRMITLGTLLLCAALGLPALAHAADPASTYDFVTGAYASDDRGQALQLHGMGILQVGSTYYAVGEDKRGENSSDAYFQDVPCYSSTDLAHWHFVNYILTRQSSGDLGPNRIIERPKLAYNASTKQYVLYMHVDSTSYSDARVGVATSASVCGNYTYQGSVRPLGNLSRDENLFIDDDGTGYLLSEDRNNGLRIDKLSSDYLTVVSAVAVLQDMEAPAMFKYQGRYYLLASHLTGWSANDDQYTTATSPAGPWSSWSDFAPAGTNTYSSQSSEVIPVAGSQATTFIYAGDRWTTGDLGDSPQIWLPLTVSGTSVSMTWYDSWNLDEKTGTWAAQTSNTTYEAEAGGNTLAGGARVLTCSGCSGGKDVGYLGKGGTLTINNVSVSTAGNYALKVSYANGDSTYRYATVVVDGSTTVPLAFPPSGGGTTTKVAVTSVWLAAGSHTIEFANSSAYGPDIDKVVVPVL